MGLSTVLGLSRRIIGYRPRGNVFVITQFAARLSGVFQSNFRPKRILCKLIFAGPYKSLPAHIATVDCLLVFDRSEFLVQPAVQRGHEELHWWSMPAPRRAPTSLTRGAVCRVARRQIST